MEKPKSICVVGLGYVGLPLAVEMAKHFCVTGFDINKKRIAILQEGRDPNNEVDPPALQESAMTFSADPSVISKADFIIVAVPTPIDSHKNPDLTPLIKASQTIGSHLHAGATIVYESTVFPGATEEYCIPVLEEKSGLSWKKDFNVGYSPERINPGDREHTFATITKVVSGDTPESADLIAHVYATAVKAGIFTATCIKVAEAAKVIENTQRDINIALMNELQIIFDKLGISTKEVLEAAGTKWNFLKFRPGLVGGHCIGVDPYYLAYKAEEIGHHPQIIMSGRRINDAMGRYYARELIKDMINKKMTIKDAAVLILGITFKENCPDIRNSRVIDIVNELREFAVQVHVWDPQADRQEVFEEYGIRLVDKPQPGVYDGVVLAVLHEEFMTAGEDGIRSYCKPEGIMYDIKEALK
ncbi:MAG: nucleotide sugar dehydrogenase [Chitinivibrionales bacterium]|nr:nucleotide sugar dehydrogenase [Chitinivibrionales bacterium]